jgi:hypothetical protein
MNAGIQRNLTSRLAGWFVAQVREWGRSCRDCDYGALIAAETRTERDGTLQQSSDWFTPIPSRAAEFVDQFGF